jgi:membrane protein YqaA with SNARE-associated domain
MDLLAGYMDLLSISMSLVALVLGAAIGWLIARSRFRTTIAERNTKLILERRVNKQLYEKAQIDAVAGLMGASNLTTSGEPARQPMAVSG